MDINISIPFSAIKVLSNILPDTVFLHENTPYKKSNDRQISKKQV